MSAALPETRQTPRPIPVPPADWHRTLGPGHEQWTWTDEGLPVASVLVSRHGEIAPVLLRDPERYWMDAARFSRAARALTDLARYLAQRGPR